MQKHRKAFHEAGCSSFLSKPLERPALHLILKQYLTLTTTQPRTSSDRRKGGDRRKESDHQVEKEAPLTDLQEIDSALSSAAMDESMLEMFNEFATEHYESLSIALAERDWEQIGSISHTIKGVGGTFGFPELSELGATICDGLEENKQPITVAEMLLSRLKAISSNPP
jgi:HPt (histidine-containing phosphotransfer) domain-containing protein